MAGRSLQGLGFRVYGDLIIIYPKPYSIYLRGTIGLRAQGLGSDLGFMLGVYWGCTGLMLGVCWGYNKGMLGLYWANIYCNIGIMEKKMETTSWGLGHLGVSLVLELGYGFPEFRVPVMRL